MVKSLKSETVDRLHHVSKNFAMSTEVGAKAFTE